MTKIPHVQIHPKNTPPIPYQRLTVRVLNPDRVKKTKSNQKNETIRPSAYFRPLACGCQSSGSLYLAAVSPGHRYCNFNPVRVLNPVRVKKPKSNQKNETIRPSAYFRPLACGCQSSGSLY